MSYQWERIVIYCSIQQRRGDHIRVAVALGQRLNVFGGTARGDRCVWCGDYYQSGKGR